MSGVSNGLRLGVRQANSAFHFLLNDLHGRLPLVFSFTDSKAGFLEQCRGRSVRVFKWSIRRVAACKIGVVDEWFKTTIYLFTDSSGARGTLQRQGVGRVRHLSCRILWLQDLICNGSIKLCAIAGAMNPADIGKKRFPASRMRSLMSFAWNVQCCSWSC